MRLSFAILPLSAAVLLSACGSAPKKTEPTPPPPTVMQPLDLGGSSHDAPYLGHGHGRRLQSCRQHAAMRLRQGKAEFIVIPPCQRQLPSLLGGQHLKRRR